MTDSSVVRGLSNKTLLGDQLHPEERSPHKPGFVERDIPFDEGLRQADRTSGIRRCYTSKARSVSGWPLISLEPTAHHYRSRRRLANLLTSPSGRGRPAGNRTDGEISARNG